MVHEVDGRNDEDKQADGRKQLYVRNPAAGLHAGLVVVVEVLVRKTLQEQVPHRREVLRALGRPVLPPQELRNLAAQRRGVGAGLEQQVRLRVAAAPVLHVLGAGVGVELEGQQEIELLGGVAGHFPENTRYDVGAAVVGLVPHHRFAGYPLGGAEKLHGQRIRQHYGPFARQHLVAVALQERVGEKA
jgi:hypothetical protein